jgi:hypothetical protein
VRANVSHSEAQVVTLALAGLQPVPRRAPDLFHRLWTAPRQERLWRNNDRVQQYVQQNGLILFDFDIELRPGGTSPTA